jgi:hypothetical protein
MKRRLLLALTLSIFVLAVVPAVADRAMSVSLTAGTRITKGDASFNGTLTWTNKSREVRLNGSLDDLCPGDGYAAGIAFFTSVDEGEFKLVDVYGTKGKCKVPPMNIARSVGSGGAKKKITGVKLLVFEADGDRAQAPTGSGWGDHFESLYFNPGGK